MAVNIFKKKSCLLRTRILEFHNLTVVSLNLQILMLSLKRQLSRDYKLFDENHDLKTK